MKSNNEGKVFSQYDASFNCYCRMIDFSSPYLDMSPEYGFHFLKFKQSYFNDLLRSRGYVLLNEVYESLGFEKVDKFENVGWLYREKDPTRDNFVDFGLYNSINIDAINGESDIFLLDFNVDGVIRY